MRIKNLLMNKEMRDILMIRPLQARYVVVKTRWDEYYLLVGFSQQPNDDEIVNQYEFELKAAIGGSNEQYRLDSLVSVIATGYMLIDTMPTSLKYPLCHFQSIESAGRENARGITRILSELTYENKVREHYSKTS